MPLFYQKMKENLTGANEKERIIVRMLWLPASMDSFMVLRKRRYSVSSLL